MGNTTSAYQPVSNTATAANTDQQTETTANSTSTNVVDQPQNAVPVSPAPVNPVPVAAPAPKAPGKKNVDPLIEMVYRGFSEDDIIKNLDAFLGKREIGKDSNGQPLYEVVDQTMYIAPVLYIFSDAANYGKTKVVQWLMDNFVPLNVSYDNNFCYFESQKWNFRNIADMIAQHESFNPSMEVLDDLLARYKYDIFKKCMWSPHLRDDMHKYRYTFMHYVDTNQFSAITQLLNKIKQRKTGAQVEISDPIHPNPRLVKHNAAAVVTTPMTTDVVQPHNAAAVVTTPMTAETAQPPVEVTQAAPAVEVNQPEPMQLEVTDVVVEPAPVYENVTVTITYDQTMPQVENNQ